MPRTTLRTLCSSLLALGCGLVAHATPISAGTYNLTNATVSAGSTSYTLTGTVTLGATGLLTGAKITLNDPAVGNPVFNVVSGAGGPAGYMPVADYGYVTATGVGQLYLSYLTTLDGSGNIDLCILSASDCNAYQASNSQLYMASAFGYNPVDLNSGSFNPAATSVTPEPDSLLLLATGLSGVAALVRRRVQSA